MHVIESGCEIKTFTDVLSICEIFLHKLNEGIASRLARTYCRKTFLNGTLDSEPSQSAHWRRIFESNSGLKQDLTLAEDGVFLRLKATEPPNRRVMEARLPVPWWMLRH